MKISLELTVEGSYVPKRENGGMGDLSGNVVTTSFAETVIRKGVCSSADVARPHLR